MEIKIKLNEVAKDFDKPSKELVEVLNEKFPDAPKKTMSTLTPEELNYAFEYYTQNNQVESFDKYFAMQPAPKAEPKKEEKAAPAEKKEKIPTKKTEEA
ncbi:MAG: translation initiation factor IF-2 N-terminal domain-containing protein, partial [Clostridia bacterium]|nr:translation initiation factor IF-2 N-terminal domain-containing protein [Clostridia bacterium]